MKTKIFTLFALFMISITAVNAQSEGYEKSFEVGGSLGLDDYSKYGVSVAMINGYRINEHYYIGFGIGYKYSESVYETSSDYIGYQYQGYSIDRDSKNMIQFFARFKASLSDSKVAPFCQFDIGGALDCTDDDVASSGVMIEPAIGVSFNGKDPSSAVYLTLGYSLQNATYTYNNLYPGSLSNTEKSRLIGQVALKLGFVF